MIETLWRRFFTFGFAIGIPIGVLVSIAGLVLGLLGHSWVFLWIGISVMALSLALALYALLAPMLRLATGKKFYRQVDPNVVGQDVAWEEVQGKVFRVVGFIPQASVHGEKVEANSRFEPYAILKIERPDYGEPLIMPVLHRLDFLHLWKCFDEQAVGAEEELLLSYQPSRLGKIMPHLGLMIGPKGAAADLASGVPAMDIFTLTRIYWNPEGAWGH